MKVLAVKFSESQLKGLKGTADVLGVSVSVIARAALSLGTEQIDIIIRKGNQEKAKKLAIVSDALSKR
jgi:hypothetical protein